MSRDGNDAYVPVALVVGPGGGGEGGFTLLEGEG